MDPAGIDVLGFLVLRGRDHATEVVMVVADV